MSDMIACPRCMPPGDPCCPYCDGTYGVKANVATATTDAEGDHAAMSDIIERLRRDGEYDPSEDLVRDPVCRDAIDEIVLLRDINIDLLAACKAALRLRGAANREGAGYATRDTKPVGAAQTCDGIEAIIQVAIARAEGRE